MNGTTCGLCGEFVENPEPGNMVADIQAFDHHLKVLHPDISAEVVRWPDGSPVIHEDPGSPSDSPF